MGTTKEKILLTALELFARDGYEAVSVSQIAGELGMVKSALYKHYKSKQDIFDHILERMNQMDYERAQEYDMPEEAMEKMAEKYAATPLEKIKVYSKAQFSHWTEDEFSSAFRRMLTIEQFRSKEMSDLYQQYLCGGPIEYMADLFGKMTGKPEKAMQLALDFYSPMYISYSLYDAATTEERKKEIIEMLMEHIERFATELQKQ